MNSESEKILSSLKWCNEPIMLERIEEKFGFPIIAKLTPKTEFDYGAYDARYVLLFGKKFLTRVIAQTIQTGHYVVGKQIEIPTNSTTTFRLSEKYDRPGIQERSFKSVEEIAEVLPSTVYIHQQLVVCPQNDESNQSNYLFQIGDEFTVIRASHDQQSHKHGLGPQRLLKRNNIKKNSSLHVYCKRLDINISLPFSIRANFSTQCPQASNNFLREVDLTAAQIVQTVNFPCSVVVAGTRRHNSPCDEFSLRSGCHLKLTGAEDHRFVLGLARNGKFFEFSSFAVSFFLPQAVVNSASEEAETYKKLLQRVCLSCKTPHSAENSDSYVQSVRFHINRSMRASKPKPLAASVLQRLKEERQMKQQQQANCSGGTRVARLRTQFSLVSEGGDDTGPPLPPRNTALPPPPPPILNHQRVRSHTFHDKPLPPTPVDSPASHRTSIGDNDDDDGGDVDVIMEDLKQFQKAPPLDAQSGGGGYSGASAHLSTPSRAVDQMETAASRDSSPTPPTPATRSSISGGESRKDAAVARTAINSAREENDYDLDSAEAFIAPSPAAEVELPAREAISSATSQQLVSPIVRTASPPPPPRHTATQRDDDQDRVCAKTKRLRDGDYIECSISPAPLVNLTGEIAQEARIEDMTIEDLADSLRSVGFKEEQVLSLMEEQVDGCMLVSLNDEILDVDFGLSRFDRHKLQRFIAGWRPKRRKVFTVTQ